MIRPPPVNIEKLLAEHCAADDELVALGCGVSTEVPAGIETLDHWLQLSLFPGAVTDPATSWLIDYRAQASCWGSTKAAAFAVAAAAVPALLTAQDVPHELGVVTSAVIAATPYWSPDPEQNLPRYIFTATITAHPSTATAS